MEKRYDPHLIEQHWYDLWEKAGYFSPEHAAKVTKDNAYCIMMPPPNVTGVLHLGHAFQASLQDALIRYHRMQGFQTLWQVGTDHAGIATQMVVERQLLANNQTRHALGREAFCQHVWDWKAQSGGHITSQLRRLGVSTDWNRERFTMDPELTHAVHDAFIRLYRDGLIYRGKRLVNWDPKLRTAISDLEVVTKEVEGSLWHIRYSFTQGDGYLVVATTRPETLFGDAAVAVNPNDERYQSLIGKTLQLPLCDRTIPIIADPYVDPAFGTGCVKITPAHDFNDYAVGKRHELPLINVLNPDATLNDQVPLPYQGLDRNSARKQVVHALIALGSIEKTEKHTHHVPHGDRSDAVIEPYLTDQWFVKMASFAQPAIDAVKSKRIQFVPDHWETTYFQWLNQLDDWCISRQLWWGHRIPAWHDETGKIYAGHSESDVRAHYQLPEDVTLKQDNDVLDTWFSSALWPFSTLGWPNKTDDLNNFYPTHVLVTGFDLIFFWVARMVMFGLHFTGAVPFKTVYITPLIRDADGQKMSKSKGNTIDPIDVIDGIALAPLIEKNTQQLMQPAMAKHIAHQIKQQFPQGIPALGTDALRFTCAALAGPGRNANFDLDRVIGARNFCNKLWNAARYISMRCDISLNTEPTHYLADRWIRSQLQRTIEKTQIDFKQYRFDLLCNKLYDFTWHTFCDWYLELVKVTDTSDYSLVITFETLLRLLHPFMPYITETIWQTIAPRIHVHGPSIMLQPYPQVDHSHIDPASETDMQWIQAVVIGIRTIRSSMGIAPSKQIPLYLSHGSQTDHMYFQTHQQILRQLAKLDSITWLNTKDPPPKAATALVDQLELLIPLDGLIDHHAEQNRLEKELNKLQKQLLKIELKLNNPKFTECAPQTIVEKEQTLYNQLKTAIEQLKKKRNYSAN